MEKDIDDVIDNLDYTNEELSESLTSLIDCFDSSVNEDISTLAWSSVSFSEPVTLLSDAEFTAFVILSIILTAESVRTSSLERVLFFASPKPKSGEVRECINNAAVQGRRSVGGVVGRFEPYTDIDLSYQSAKAAIEKDIDTFQNDISSARTKLIEYGLKLLTGSNDVSGLMSLLGLGRKK